MNQQIDGDGNIQVGHFVGDLTIAQPDAVDPNNPNMAPCPACGNYGYWRIEACRRCGFPILKFVLEKEDEYRRKEMSIKGVIAIVIGAALMAMTSLSWIPDSWKGQCTIFGLVALFIGFAILSAADRVR